MNHVRIHKREIDIMNWKLVLGILTANVLFMSSSYTMLIPFLPMYLTLELGVPESDVNIWSGIVFSASFVMSAVMAPIWGKLADKKGKRLMAIRASFLLSISYFLGGIVQTPEQLALMRLFQGFAAGLWPMELAIMSLYSPPDKLGVCIGILQGVLTAGSVIGPLIGGVLAEYFGMRASFYLAAGALFVNCLAFVFVIKEPPAPEAPSNSPKKDQSSFSLLRRPVIATLLCASALVQMVILILQPILTTYISSLAGELSNLVLVSGIVFSLGGIAGAAAAPCWGWFGQHNGFVRAMLMAMLLGGCALIVQGTMTELYSFAAMQFVCGLFFCGIHPSLNSLLAKCTEPSVKGQIFGLMFAAQQIGSILGPILGGVVATYFGMHSVFFAAGAVLIFMSLTLRMNKKRLPAA